MAPLWVLCSFSALQKRFISLIKPIYGGRMEGSTTAKARSAVLHRNGHDRLTNEALLDRLTLASTKREEEDLATKLALEVLRRVAYRRWPRALSRLQRLITVARRVEIKGKDHRIDSIGGEPVSVRKLEALRRKLSDMLPKELAAPRGKAAPDPQPQHP